MPTASPTQQPSPDTAKSVLVVHDGEGTWFPVSSLKLVALSPDELEELEEGNEDVLEDRRFWNVRAILDDALGHELGESAEWT